MNKTPFSFLENQRFMSLTTYRKSGAIVTTPVWFAMEHGGTPQETLLFYSANKAGKIKRIRNISKVLVAPCTSNGTLLSTHRVEGVARILSAEEFLLADQKLTAKYGFAKTLISSIYQLIGFDAAYVEIKPVS